MDGGYDGGQCRLKRVVKGHGMKGRCHKAWLKAFEYPTIITNVGWQNFP